jgi:UDP-2,3-diacylglucosamine hydrolase
MKLGPSEGENNPPALGPACHRHLVTSHYSLLPSTVMQDPPIYLASDVHLGVAPPETEPAFLAWLEFCGREASRVVINGDLFDFWFEYRSVIPRGHTRILGALASLVDSGVPVVLMGGNHDWWGGDFLTNEIGVDFLREPTVLDLQGRKTLLAHGDGLGSGDLGYRVLRQVLRGSLTRFAFRWLHPDAGAWVARKVSNTESHSGGASKKQKERSEFLERWAVEKLTASPDLDLVVLGHTHVPVLKEVFPGRHYLNAGDWLVNRSFAVLSCLDAPRILEWRDGRPSEIDG